jgi:hypothetical protein
MHATHSVYCSWHKCSLSDAVPDKFFVSLLVICCAQVSSLPARPLAGLTVRHVNLHELSSPEFQYRAVMILKGQIEGKIPPDPNRRDANLPFSISWNNNGCQDGAAYGAMSCPHATFWTFTPSDALFAQACQVGFSAAPWQCTLSKPKT